MSLKEDILADLTENEFVSGENMAEKYYVSRNSIWKAVKQLRDEGYDIEAVTNKGYRLKMITNNISSAAIKKSADQDWKYVILDKVDSTNNYAKELVLNGDRKNTVVIAESQIGGRGRVGRPFYSPKGNGLYMSILIYPKLNVEYATLITTFTAVAVAKAIEKLTGGSTLNIKWVNDIYMNGKKICGILTEAGFDFEGGAIDYAIIGIGINVFGTEFPDSIKNIATSIEKETGKIISRNELAVEILNNLSNIQEAIKDKTYLDYYREKSNVIGKNVLVINGDNKFNAKAICIDDNAALIVETEDGMRTLNSGEVSIKI